jgi:hypothetical protein
MLHSFEDGELGRFRPAKIRVVIDHGALVLGKRQPKGGVLGQK